MSASKYVDVLGSKIHYLDEGVGHPILFLHGMPTSSHMWRKIIPLLAPLGRCIAPDLIGMGKSGKPDIAYTISEHIQYIDAFIQALNLKRITIVMHGWGSIIGCDYAMRHEKNCRGLVFYESYLQPLGSEEMSLPFQEQMFMLQDQANSAELILNTPYFVEKVIPQAMIDPLPEEDMAVYRAPYLQPGSGKPLHQYLLEMFDETEQQKTNAIIKTIYSKIIHLEITKTYAIFFAWFHQHHVKCDMGEKQFSKY